MIGVATMKIGELAQLECASDVAYGARGSPPKIPGGATLNFEVELLDFNDKKNVTEDGGVRKKVLREGQGYEKPTFGAVVKVIITGRVNGPRGDVFLEKKEPSDIKFTDPEVCYGLESALFDMNKGEHSQFWIKPDYGFGTKANEQFNIPANSSVWYEIELVSFVKDKDTWEQTLQEKLDAADARKVAGNARFGNLQFFWASYTYSEALNNLDSLEEKGDDIKAQVNNLKGALSRNVAACQLKLKNYPAVVLACDEALDLDSKDIKALVSKGKALYFQNQPKEAATTLQSALDIDSENAQAKKFLKGCQQKLKKIEERERKLYGNMFG